VVVGDATTLPPADGQLTIIVGVDGSGANADSVNTIARIAGELGARTVPVLSVNTGASTSRDKYGAHLLHEDEAAAIAARLPNSEPLETINAGPVDGLIDAATEWNADLIAIGTRGHRTLTDLFAGQVTRHLIDHSPRPVLVSPHH
jgi:nucleotide-binding universal stress UspA family protein